MEWSEIEGRIDTAIRVFLARDPSLLTTDANERSISHRLAMHLQSCFGEGWDVDCEYNREGQDPKRLLLPIENTSTDCLEARTVFPDIIVHKRGPDGPNLLALEMKKSGCDPEAIAKDHQKLRAYLEKPSLKYDFAAFLMIRTGAAPGFEKVERIQSD